MTVKGSHYDYKNQAWTVDGRYVACGHRESNCGCYGKTHAGEAAPIENLPTVTNPEPITPTVDQWHAIVDAMNAMGLKATLQGGGAACPFVGIELQDGKYIAFGDNADNWTGDVYADLNACEIAETCLSITIPVPSSVFDPERIADETVKAIRELRYEGMVVTMADGRTATWTLRVDHTGHIPASTKVWYLLCDDCGGEVDPGESCECEP